MSPIDIEILKFKPTKKMTLSIVPTDILCVSDRSRTDLYGRTYTECVLSAALSDAFSGWTDENGLFFVSGSHNEVLETWRNAMGGGHVAVVRKSSPAKLPTCDLTAELRKRGFAVCVFTWEDAFAQCGHDKDSAKVWMSDHRKALEEAMCQAGNEYIDGGG